MNTRTHTHTVSQEEETTRGTAGNEESKDLNIVPVCVCVCVLVSKCHIYLSFGGGGGKLLTLNWTERAPSVVLSLLAGLGPSVCPSVSPLLHPSVQYNHERSRDGEDGDNGWMDQHVYIHRDRICQHPALFYFLLSPKNTHRSTTVSRCVRT